LNRTVALRQVQVPEWLDDVDDLIKRILAEAQAASVLNHPNIARLYTGGYKGFTVFLTTEFIDGTPIREYALKRNLGIPEILALGKQLCAAIDHAHQKNVLHNALTPANLKVMADGQLKVLDFGLLRDKQLYSPIPAKRLESEHYLSPEQLRNKPVSQAANVFSAATILYELLTTRNPFSGKHLGEVDRNITEIDPPPASQAHSRVSESLSKVLMKGLAKHPLARYQSCAEFAVALEEGLKPSAAKTAAPSPPVVSASPIAPAAPAPSTKPANNIFGAPVTPVAAGVNGQPPAAPNRPSAIAPAQTPSVPATPAAPPKAPQTPKAPQIRPPQTSVRAEKRPPAPPSKMPAKMLTQWKLAGGIVAALFLVSAVTISLNHRSKVSTPPPEPAPVPEAAAPAPQKPQAPEPVTAPTPEAEPPPAATAEVQESEVQESRPRASRQRTANRGPVPGALSDGTLAISSEPEGASFSIEGRTTEAWKTPQVVGSLAPAVYKVIVSKAGYSTETRNIQVVGGNRVSLDVKLTALKATLNIAGTPVGARIVIDGKDTGKFSPASFTLDPAVHTISLRREGFFDHTGQIRLAAGQAASYSPSLMPQGRTDNIRVVGGMKKLFGGSSEGMAHMEIRTDPKGAEVLVNGAALSKATPLEIQLEPGNYEIVLQKDGYKAVRKMIMVQDNDKLKIDEQLSR
jgi:serine/threonine-protein kinase